MFNPISQECLADFKRDMIIVTAGTSGLACFLMGMMANVPFALAPGMGINA